MPRVLDKEQFRRKWIDTHQGLSALDAMNEGKKSQIKYPEDRGVSKVKVSGKTAIESASSEKKDPGKALSEVLVDAVFCRLAELLEVPIEKVTALAIRSLPQQVAISGGVDPDKLNAIFEKDLAVDAEFNEPKRLADTK